jgi:HB1/ASXL restriction endonuclease-like protein with HTH domain
MAAAKNPKNLKPKKARKQSPEAEPKGKKLSALDAAAQVLAETGKPMACKEMIEAMAAKGYWSSPGGKTPASTLYSGILKEIATKGKESRFKKTDRGRFART